MQPVRVNIITGFLGAGKTTSILNLIANHDQQERWAVLVNEFGTIGIDGAMIGSQSDNKQIAVKEVPGGCLCCAAGLPFQIGLNQLIAKERPDRLFIEPTGLGHLKEIIATLQQAHYKDVLQLDAVICLVEPKSLSDERYTSNDIFNDQLNQADILIGNKKDLAEEKDLQAFESLVQCLQPARSLLTSEGRFDLQWLSLPHIEKPADPHHHGHHHHHDEHKPALAGACLQGDEDWRRFEGSGQGWFSYGWILIDRAIFDHNRLMAWCYQLEAERVKGVIRTDLGWKMLNIKDGAVTLHDISQAGDSRLEIIHSQKIDIDILEQQFLQCIVKLEN